MADLMEGLALCPNGLARRSSRGSLSSFLNCVTLSDLPRASRRLDTVCAPGYMGRKRGEVVRTRTTLLLAHTHQWFGTYAGPGNGDYRGDLLHALEIITRYAAKQDISLARIILRLDGQYGDFAVIVDVARNGLCYPLSLTLFPE